MFVVVLIKRKLIILVNKILMSIALKLIFLIDNFKPIIYKCVPIL